jgi:hypothetical protein
MRFPQNAFSLLTTGKQGAIMEPGDGETVVPTVLTATAIIPFPLSPSQANGAISESFVGFDARQSNGIQVAYDQQAGINPAAGLWYIEYLLDVSFTGTANSSGAVALSLWRSGAFSLHLLRCFLGATPFHRSLKGAIWLNAIDALWVPTLSGPATIGGDALVASYIFNASRVL